VDPPPGVVGPRGAVIACEHVGKWVIVFAGALAVARAFAFPPAPAYASEDAGIPAARLTCDRADAPGRVRCEIEANVGVGESIAWGDVVLIATPPFVSALRGRIAPRDATTRDPVRWRWAFALVAHGKGSGDLSARVRLVVCRGATCSARELSAVGRVVVGPPS
jgi:hypothetical protein